QPREETSVAEAPPPMAPAANGTADDQAGFNRILQMLGNTGIQPPASQEGPHSPPSKASANGMKPKSRFTGFFDQTPKSPERVQSPPEVNSKPNEGDMFAATRTVSNEPSSVFSGKQQESYASEQFGRGPF